MKILIDNNLPVSLAGRLRVLSCDAVHLRELAYQQAPDRMIWNYAIEHGYAVLTKDADFCKFSDLYGHPPKVIWLGIGNAERQQTVEIVLGCKNRIESFLNNAGKSLLILP